MRRHAEGPKRSALHRRRGPAGQQRHVIDRTAGTMPRTPAPTSTGAAPIASPSRRFQRRHGRGLLSDCSDADALADGGHVVNIYGLQDGVQLVGKEQSCLLVGGEVGPRGGIWGKKLDSIFCSMTSLHHKGWRNTVHGDIFNRPRTFPVLSPYLFLHPRILPSSTPSFPPSLPATFPAAASASPNLAFRPVMASFRWVLV